MESVTSENIVEKLGNLSVLEVISLTKKLEELWGVKAEPLIISQPTPQNKETIVAQTEFDVVITAVPTDKKIAIIKAIRDVLTIGLKEAKEFTESMPKTIKEKISAEEAELVKFKLSEAGAVVEVK